MMFNTQYNYKKVPGKVFTKPSMTVPGMYYPVRELLDNYNLPPSIARNGMYDENEDVEPLPVAIDLTDVEDNAERVIQIREELKKKSTPIPTPTPTPTPTPIPTPSPAPPSVAD